MKRRIVFQKVARFALHRDAFGRPSDLQSDFDAKRHSGTHINVLRIRSKPRHVDTEMVRIEGNVGKLNRTALSVVVDRSNWLTGLWISMVAPGTTAPDGSATTPLSDEFPVVCALPLMTQSAKQNIASAIALINLYCKAVWFVSCVEIISSPISLAPRSCVARATKCGAACRKQWKMHACTRPRTRHHEFLGLGIWIRGLEAPGRGSYGRLEATHSLLPEARLESIADSVDRPAAVGE